MAKGSDLDRVTAIVLREMRPPLVVLVCAYTLGIAGMVLIPGIDGEPMSLFHAFYFMTYTATTTGFGELPREFSDPQRMWATLCLYMSVIAWIYAIGKIIQVVQNPHFTDRKSGSMKPNAIPRHRRIRTKRCCLFLKTWFPSGLRSPSSKPQVPLSLNSERG